MRHTQHDADRLQILLLCQEIATRVARLRHAEARLRSALYRRLLSVVRERIRRLNTLLARYCN